MSQFPHDMFCNFTCMKIALASPHLPESIADGLLTLEKMVKEASAAKAEIICFPESYFPGYPLDEHAIEGSTPEKMKVCLQKACVIARENSIAIVLPMDWYNDRNEALNVAYVISASGDVLGYQTKNQLDPSEDKRWIPGNKRNIFEMNGMRFGIAICHEGFRYPETVRWAARQGASIVFHPHCTGSNVRGEQLTEWGNKSNPYYEKAIMMRALENTIYFAGINYTMKYPESATALIAPDGTCIAYELYNNEGVLIADIDLELATGLLAKRFKPELYDQ